MASMRGVIALMGLFLLAAGCASATFITLTTTLTSEGIVYGNQTVINVSIENSGDEPARNLQMEFDTPKGFSSTKLYPRILQPEKSYNGTFDVSIVGDVKPGTYPFFMVTHYTDANGYPFSSLTSINMVYLEPTPTLVDARIENVEIFENNPSTLKLRIRNRDSIPHQLTVRILLPNELKVEPQQQNVTVEGKEEKELLFTVSSFGAIPGSNYQVYAALEYEDARHYSSVTGGMVDVVKKENPVSLPKWIPALGVLILALILVMFQFRSSK